jgi:transposase-like protein
MKTPTPTRSRRSAAQWAALVEQSKSTSLSVRDLCEQANVPLGQFYYWRSKLGAVVEPKPRGFRPVRLRAPVEPQAANAGAIELSLRNGRVVRVVGAVDVQVLQTVIMVAEEGVSC